MKNLIFNDNLVLLDCLKHFSQHLPGINYCLVADVCVAEFPASEEQVRESEGGGGGGATPPPQKPNTGPEKKKKIFF